LTFVNRSSSSPSEASLGASGPGSRELAFLPPGPPEVAGARDVQQRFAQLGVCEISEFFAVAEFATLREHIEAKIRRGFFRSMDGDAQLQGAPCEYGDPVAEHLLRIKASFLSDLLHLDLVATYSYLRLYRPGDRLPAHRDRPACEITVSASLDADPKWPLRLLVEGNIFDSCPQSRGAIAFRGHDLLHWRDELSGSGPSVHVLLHYVLRNGPFQSWADDRRSPEFSETSKKC
jgi:hypothetical protein